MYYIIKLKKLTYNFQILEKFETLICCLKKLTFFIVRASVSVLVKSNVGATSL